MLWYALAFLDFNCFCSGVKVRLFIAFALAFALAFGSGLLLLLGSPVAGVPGSSVAGVLGSSVGGVLLAAAFAFALAFAFGSLFAFALGADLAFGADLALPFPFAFGARSVSSNLFFGFLPLRLLSGEPKSAPAATQCSQSGGGPGTLD